MRRARRGGGGLEFGGSGEDSFVAVVVTKLTGALLFILLLSLVIVALVPKAIDERREQAAGETQAGQGPPLEITTPDTLPEAVEGRTYRLALAARGGSGPLRWSIDGALPEGLTFSPEDGTLSGAPVKATESPALLVLRVTDGAVEATAATRFEVLPAVNASTGWAQVTRAFTALNWRTWLEHGFGFVLLVLVYLVGMNALGSLERLSVVAAGTGGSEVIQRGPARRFALYRWSVRAVAVASLAGLLVWMGTAR